MSTGRVAELTGASERTVLRVSGEPRIEDIAARDAAAHARSGRPSKVAKYLPRLRKWLEDEPDLAGVTLLSRLRKKGYDGGKSAFYDALRSVRKPAPTSVLARFEGLAGEFAQHDFGQVWVRYLDGTRERLHFFASALKFSRLRHVRVTPDETTESVCRGLAEAYEYFGGAPLVSVFDNPRTIVAGRDGDQVRWQLTFAHFCTEVGVVPIATWPRRPQEKGLAENTVGFAKRTFFKVHRFEDRADLLRHLERWHQEVNDERVCRATGETPRTRHLLEVTRLQPLPFGEDGFRLRYSRRVRPDGHAEFGGLRYYCGKRLVGRTVTLHVGEHEVVVHDGADLVATHPRRPVNGSYSVLPEQRSELLEKRGARPYTMRQLLLDLCPAATWMLTEIRHRRPDHWSEQVERLYALLERHGEAALRSAFIDAAAREVVGAEYVEAILAGHAAEAVAS